MANPSPNQSTRFSKDNPPNQELAKAGREAKWSIQAALRMAMADTAVRSPTGKITNAERVARAHLKRALAGDTAAIKEAYDRIDGKTVDKQAITDTQGHDVALDDRAFGVWLASKLGKPNKA